jgi:hypothetical protein
MIVTDYNKTLCILFFKYALGTINSNSSFEHTNWSFCNIAYDLVNLGIGEFLERSNF